MKVSRPHIQPQPAVSVCQALANHCTQFRFSCSQISSIQLCSRAEVFGSIFGYQSGAMSIVVHLQSVSCSKPPVASVVGTLYQIIHLMRGSLFAIHSPRMISIVGISSQLPSWRRLPLHTHVHPTLILHMPTVAIALRI